MLDDALADVRAFEIRLGPAIVTTSAVELYVESSRELLTLQAKVAAACRTAFPGYVPRPIEAAFRPRSVIAHCMRGFNDEGLEDALLDTDSPAAGVNSLVRMRVDEVVLAVVDDRAGPWPGQGGEIWELPFGETSGPPVVVDPAAKAYEARQRFLSAERKAHRRMDPVFDAEEVFFAAEPTDVEEARLEWWECAPDGPSAWWPGGWRLRGRSGAVHYHHGVWRRRSDAEAFLDEQVSMLDTRGEGRSVPDLCGASVEWVATVGRTALDLGFWNTHPVSRFLPRP
ncbi:hypothetical protein CFP71_41000 [Amycolatopsis thailandensis]|uniref:Uncharacterized protein n=1 Tax=Amycolatopsis thailandensis TaxID=589330 RepID=A0A229RC61_9PSEU|nr:hypothetical protein [Amycolatopsis thailandensis]OXM44014.1 hypothetical protein CFP71_41000 [Amycolatopsis thailandensis]